MEWFLFTSFFLELFAGVSGFRTFESTEFLRSPDFGDIFLVLERVYGTSDVAACACSVVPCLYGAFLVVEIEPVVSEEVCVLGDVFEGGCEGVV